MKISIPKLAVSLAALAGLVAIATSPHLLGDKVREAVASLQGADPTWVAVAAVGFFGGFVAYVGAWRAGLAAAGGRICPRQAAARLGVGSLVNSVAPAKLGDAVKIALCSKAIEGPDRIWTASGVYAALGAARALTLAGLVVAASATGALPLWPVFLLCGGVALIGVVAASSSRWRRWHRVAHLVDAFAALERSPRAAASVLGWTAAIALTRLGATAAIAEAFGVREPLLAALVIMAAMDLASIAPITPGNVGIVSGAIAVALQPRGVPMTQALGIGIAIQALETLVSLCAGTAGAVYLASPRPGVRRWTFRVVAVASTAVAVTFLGVFVLDVV